MPANSNEIEKRLWDAADELRANSRLKASEYSVPVLGLIFLRYADHKFAQADQEIKAERAVTAGRRQRPITKDNYHARGVLFLPDEARFQYDILAMNMRHALPNAAFLAYTATPLIVGEERTRQVFGQYVSVYSYKQSNEDQATVPLYYENRVPEVQLTNQQLNEDMDRLLEEAELDDAQEAALAQVFSDEYQVITRDDRLEKVAEDIVSHFVNRGYLGKAMVVSYYTRDEEGKR